MASKSAALKQESHAARQHGHSEVLSNPTNAFLDASTADQHKAQQFIKITAGFLELDQKQGIIQA